MPRDGPRAIYSFCNELNREGQLMEEKLPYVLTDSVVMLTGERPKWHEVVYALDTMVGIVEANEADWHEWFGSGENEEGDGSDENALEGWGL